MWSQKFNAQVGLAQRTMEKKRNKEPRSQACRWNGIVRNWIEPWQYFQKIKITYKLLQTLDMLLWKQPEQTRNSFSLSHVEILGRFQEILCAEGQKQLKARASMEGPKVSKLYFLFFFLIKLTVKQNSQAFPSRAGFLFTHTTHKQRLQPRNETALRRTTRRDGGGVWGCPYSRLKEADQVCVVWFVFVCFLAKLEKEISRPRSWKRKWKIIRTFQIQMGLVQS